MKLFQIIALFALPLFCVAQAPPFDFFEWDKPERVELDSATELLYISADIHVDQRFEDDGFFERRLIREVYIVNSSDEIENNNRVYIPTSPTMELTTAEVRTISPSGEEQFLTDDKILTGMDDDSGQEYSYFALEGLELGSIIDYYYIIRTVPSYQGVRFYTQRFDPISTFRFSLQTPPALIYDIEVYNTSDTLIEIIEEDEYRKYSYTTQDVPGMVQESESPSNILRSQLVYAMDRNLANGKSGISSFAELSQNYGAAILKDWEPSEQKVLAKIKKEFKIDQSLSPGEKLASIESYVKDNYNIVQSFSGSWQEAYKQKVLTAFKSTRLMARLALDSGVEVQLVFPVDRTSYVWDPGFNSYHYFSQFLLYEPESEMYIDPSSYTSRRGGIDYELTDAHALFISLKTVGGYDVIKHDFGKVPAPSYTYTQQNINSHTVLDLDAETAEIEMEVASSGYYASFFQPYADRMDKDDEKNIATMLYQNYFAESDPLTYEFLNSGVSHVGVDPWLQKFTGDVAELLTSAGPNYLFKAGQLIGPQSELYSEKDRTQPLQIDYKRTFNRDLYITLPPDYKVENLEDLIIDEQMIVDGDVEAKFVSSYKVEGDQIHIRIDEYYDRVWYDVHEYEDYRRVINAAADFQKVVLVLAPY